MTRYDLATHILATMAAALLAALWILDLLSWWMALGGIWAVLAVDNHYTMRKDPPS